MEKHGRAAAEPLASFSRFSHRLQRYLRVRSMGMVSGEKEVIYYRKMCREEEGFINKEIWISDGLSYRSENE